MACGTLCKQWHRWREEVKVRRKKQWGKHDEESPSYPVGKCAKCLTCAHNFHWLCGLKKYVQLESCELSFIWGKMMTAAWEAAFQIALIDCSKAAVGESQYIRFWRRGRVRYHEALILQKFSVSHEDLMSPWRASLDVRRCKDWDHKICS